MSAGCDRPGEAVTTLTPFSGAILGASLLRMGLADFNERCGALRSLRPPAHAVGVREAGRKAGSPAAAPGLSLGRGCWAEGPPAALSSGEDAAPGRAVTASLLLLRPVERVPPAAAAACPPRNEALGFHS